MTNEEKLSEIREYIYGSKKPGGGAALALLKDVDQYIDNLEQESQKQKEILEIFKNYLGISVDYQGDNPNDLCYLIDFHNNNGKMIINKISKKQYEVLEEWLEQ